MREHRDCTLPVHNMVATRVPAFHILSAHAPISKNSGMIVESIKHQRTILLAPLWTRTWPSLPKTLDEN